MKMGNLTFSSSGARADEPEYRTKDTLLLLTSGAINPIAQRGDLSSTSNNTITAPQPDTALKSLDRLVGTWKLSGGTKGQISMSGWTAELLPHSSMSI